MKNNKPLREYMKLGAKSVSISGVIAVAFAQFLYFPITGNSFVDMFIIMLACFLISQLFVWIVRCLRGDMSAK